MKFKNVALALALVPLTLLATACGPGGGGPGGASYPTKPIEMVVPFNAGGATDIAARVISEEVSRDLKVPVNVVNKPGANQVTAVDYMMNSGPDGYTLLADGAGSSSLQSMVDNVPYGWDDRKFVARLLTGAHVYAVGKDSASQSLNDVIARAKADPANFKVAWLGGSSTSDYAMLQLLVSGDVDVNAVQRVPFQSSGETMIAAAANDVDLAVGGASAAFALHGSGDLRVLATTGEEREPKLPEVQTTAELGKPDLNILYWVGVSGPSQLPGAVTERLEESLTKASESASLKEKAAGIAMAVDLLKGDEFTEYVHTEAETFAALAAELK